MEGVDLGQWEKRTEGVRIRELLQDAGKGEAMGKDRSTLVSICYWTQLKSPISIVAIRESR